MGVDVQPASVGAAEKHRKTMARSSAKCSRIEHMLALARLQIPASRIKIVSVQSKDLGRLESVRNLDPQDTVLLSFGAAHHAICWGYSESFEAFCWFDQMI